MLGTFKEVLTNQYGAALCTLDSCIERCPDAAWKAKIVNYEFSQVVFHTLIYTDYYLGDGDETFYKQPFHVGNPGCFGGYEEFEDRIPVTLYDRPFLRSYVAFCRAKYPAVIAAETAESLAGPSPFSWLPFSRAETHVHNIRHIQSHAAQLILRLRRDFGQDMPWFKSGWPDTVLRPGAAT